MTTRKNNEVVEDEAAGRVHVGTKYVDGFISDEVCPSCGAKKVYHEKYDAFFCPQENKWLETGCNDPKCEYCGTRPNEPFS